MTEHPPNQPPLYRASIAELPASERPRERLLRLGPQALTSAELIAILLRTGTSHEGVLDLAARLIREHQGLRGIAQAGPAAIAASHGMGEAKATTVAAAFELGRRLTLEDQGERPQIQSPEDIGRILQSEMELLQQEELRLLCLDGRHRVQSTVTVYRGSVNSAAVRVGEVFREAIRRNAVAIAVAHNHPSGDPTPSAHDIELTTELWEGGVLLDVALLDHVIFGHGRFVSLRERGLGFPTTDPS